MTSYLAAKIVGVGATFFGGSGILLFIGYSIQPFATSTINVPSSELTSCWSTAWSRLGWI
jgi:hypothetical protein